MAETSPEEVRARTSRRLKNAFVSRVFKAGSEDDMKLIGRLFVWTGYTRSLSSDVWQHFGPLYSEYTITTVEHSAPSIDAVAGIAK